MASGNAEPRKRLAQYVERRVGELNLEWIALERASGVSIETIRKVRNGEYVAPRSYRKLERGLRLRPFAIDDILQGNPPPSPTAVDSPASPPALTAEELGHPVVRIVLSLEGSPQAPLPTEERIAKARETHQLIANGRINPTVQQASDPAVQAILAITGAGMDALWEAALRVYHVHAEQQRRADNTESTPDQGRSTG